MSDSGTLANRMVHTLPAWGLWASALRDFETPYGKIGFRQASVLWVLCHHMLPEPQQTPTNIAKHFGVQNSAITRAVDKLVLGGYVHRRLSDADRRVHYLVPTQKGIDVTAWIECQYTAPLQDELNKLDQAMLASLQEHIELLNTLLNTIRQLPEPIVVDASVAIVEG